MGDYIVGPLEPTDFQVDTTSVITELRKRWPTARIQQTLGNDPVRFRCYLPHGMYVALDRSQQALLLEGGIDNIEDCVSLALWFRLQVPANYELYVYDPGLHGQLELTLKTTEYEAMHFMN